MKPEGLRTEAELVGPRAEAEPEGRRGPRGGEMERSERLVSLCRRQDDI